MTPLARLLLSTVLIAAGLLVSSSVASASKQVVDFFGTGGGPGILGGEFDSPAGVAVNSSGAGPADEGDVYVVDAGNNRIQRFHREDNGTPGNPADDTYSFVSAWGADVDSTPDGGSDFEICTIADDCQGAVASGGNGTAAGNGALDDPDGVAVDEDTGNVYVSDAGSHRISVYDGTGAFLRSFGFDVVDSGPGGLPGANEQQQLIVKATGGRFSLSFDDKATAPRGTGWRSTLGSSVITQVVANEGSFAVGQGISGQAIAPGTTITSVGADSLGISQPTTGSTTAQEPLFGDTFLHTVSAAQLQVALNALPSIGGVGGSVTVSGGPGDASGSTPYVIEFGGALAGTDVPAIVPTKEGLTGSASASIAETVKGGAYEVCVAADGDVCRAGSSGSAAGEIAAARDIAVSQPDGDPGAGTVFLADAGNRRVGTFDLDGGSPSSFGSSAVFDSGNPTAIAVDSRGIAYASNQESQNQIERYDTEDANGGGVGFLAPIAAGVDEVQKVTVAASAGQFRLTFDGETTSDLPFNATPQAVATALRALPSVGPSGVNVSGGPGDPAGSSPYTVDFHGRLGAADVPELIPSNGAVPLSGGPGASVATTTNGQSGLLPFGGQGTHGLVVDPDSDGAGSDLDTLYVLRFALAGNGFGFFVQQLGPTNPPGLTAPPTATDDLHGDSFLLSSGSGIGLDSLVGRLYVASSSSVDPSGVYVLGDVGPPPTASLDSLSDPTETTITAHATVNPNGPPILSYRFEYSTDGVSWTALPSVVLGSQSSPQQIVDVLSPPGVGFEPNTSYQVRLVAQRPFFAPVITDPLGFTTLAAKPVAETVGSPHRSATTAELLGRVNPRNSATTFHFEYGDQGPCDANPCASTPAISAGSGARIALVAQGVEGLDPGVTYHYRLVADNGNPGSPVFGEDMSVTTRASDAALSHGPLPGPPGSDRAYEQVSLPDSGGNPVASGLGFAADGNQAIYRIAGGTPISDTGSIGSVYFAERQEGGWQTRLITPPRSQLFGGSLGVAGASGDLSSVLIESRDIGSAGAALWRLAPAGAPSMLFQTGAAQEYDFESAALSTGGARPVALLRGSGLDPAYPAAGGQPNLYDVSAGAPQLVSLLPGNTVAACGTANSEETFGFKPQATNWLSSDGSLAFFPSRGDSCSDQPQLYMRDFAAGQSSLVSGPVVSGRACGAAFLRATPGAVFFWTQSRLHPEDSAAPTCAGDKGDVYRYSTAGGSLECVTCVVPGLDAAVSVELSTGGTGEVAVAADGSRVYFSAARSLLPGTPGDGAYRVEVGSGNLAYVGQGNVGTLVAGGNALSPDGSVLIFRSGDPSLSPVGGAGNGGTQQYYRYDDGDRSLVCISCPREGSPPSEDVPDLLSGGLAYGPHVAPLSADGSTVAFGTVTALVGADQNTAGTEQAPKAGTDIYEWRDGRVMLVTDGLASWSEEPTVAGVSPSGRDVYFLAPIQYTPDALDGYSRLYDARIGGGFEFPVPPRPCPLEVCQGTPRGAPEEQPPGSGTLSGPGNAKPLPRVCPKGKRKVRQGNKVRCLSRKKRSGKRAGKHRANHNRKVAR